MMPPHINYTFPSFEWSESRFLGTNFYKLVAQVEASAGASEAAIDIVATWSCGGCSHRLYTLLLTFTVRARLYSYSFTCRGCLYYTMCTQWRASGVANRKLQQMTSRIPREKSTWWQFCCKCSRIVQNWLTYESKFKSRHPEKGPNRLTIVLMVNFVAGSSRAGLSWDS